MIALIANPSSRSGRGRRLWPLWLRELERSGRPFSIRETASREDCEAKAQEAARPGATVTAVGGDGTINAVITGMLRAARELPGKASPAAGAEPSGNSHPARLGVLYAGTSPDFCRFHGIPTAPDQALRTLLAGKSRPVDVAGVTYRDSRDARAFFASSCNIGLGAATAAFANIWRARLGDTAGTGLGLIRAMLTHQPFACCLVADGERLSFTSVNHVIVLKNPYIASGLRLSVPASPDDGLMHLVVIHGYSRPGLLGLARRLYSGHWANLPGVFIRRCREVALESTPGQSLEYDGDPRGSTPAAVSLLPGVLSLVCDDR